MYKVYNLHICKFQLQGDATALSQEVSIGLGWVTPRIPLSLCPSCSSRDPLGVLPISRYLCPSWVCLGLIFWVTPCIRCCSSPCSNRPACYSLLCVCN